MNYRHLFHAGNFADVFKHVALVLLLRSLQRKASPFCFVDTHAGAGRYDLTESDAQRSGEFHDGVERVWDLKSESGALAEYLAAVRALNPDGRLRFYPGSPLIARQLLRECDRMVLCEQHPDEYARLRAEFAGDRQVALHKRDGYEALKALLPPQERRGLVLLDPPYERSDEFDQVIEGLKTAQQRWATGIYAVWYPIKDRAAVTRFHARLCASGSPKVLISELTVFPEDTAFRLNGCGLAIVNPPWGFDRTLEGVLPDLRQILAQDAAARSSVVWLVTE